MSQIGKLDSAHAMYQPDRLSSKRRRAANKEPERALVRRALETPIGRVVIPSPTGSREEREAWMRERYAKRTETRLEANQRRSMERDVEAQRDWEECAIREAEAEAAALRKSNQGVK